MKFKYIILITLLAIITSCSDSFFDKYNDDVMNEGIYYDNPTAIEGLVNNAYGTLRDLYKYYFAIGELASDNAFNFKLNNYYHGIDLNESNVRSDNDLVGIYWSEAYTIINRCNLVLDNIEGASLTDTKKSQFKGEALFMRSLMYFELVRLFGGVPLVLTDMKTSAEAFNYERKSVDEVYAQILKDLEGSITNLEVIGFSYDAKEVGRATVGSARTLLGKVYLTLKEYQKAVDEFKRVINYAHYELLPNYADVFDAAKSNNEEIIFAIQFASGLGMGNELINNSFPHETFTDAGPLKMGHGSMLITDDLYNSFESGDLRKLMIRDDISGFRNPYYVTLKYYDNRMVDIVDSGCDIILLRYADLLLLYAEAEAALGNTNNAFDLVKQVRTRAGLNSPESLKADIDLTIEKERRVELHCEFHRWFDLLRTERLQTVMNAHFKSGVDVDQIGDGSSSIENYELLMPIPKSQNDLVPENFPQNPGY